MLVLPSCLKALIGLCLLTALFNSAVAQIYLTPNAASSAWSGSCMQSCTLLAPCAPSEGSVAATETSCAVTFLPGNWDGHTLTWSSPVTPNAEWAFTFEGDISLLTTNFYLSGGRFYFSGSEANLTMASIRIDSATLPVSSSVIFSNLLFWDTPIAIAGNVTADMMACQFNSTSTTGQSPIRWDTFDNGPKLTMSNCTVWSPPNLTPFIFAYSNITATFVSITGQARVLVSSQGQAAIHSKLVIHYSRLTLFDALIHPQQTATDNSHIEIVNCYLIGSVYSYDDTYLWFGAMRDTTILTSTLESILVGVDTLTRFHATTTNFIGCNFKMTSALYQSVTLNNVAFLLDRPRSFVTIYSASPHPPLTFNNVHVHVVRSQAVNQPFTFEGTILFQPSSLTTNMLWLYPYTLAAIDNLTVTDLIGYAGAGLGTKPRLVATADSYWTFHSIPITQVQVDMSLSETLRYRATLLDQGIRVDEANSFTIPSSINVTWPDMLRPVPDHPYPLINGTTGLPIIRVDAILREQGYQHVATFTQIYGLVELIFSIKKTCAPPPTGFTCVDGIWVEDGSGGTTTTVTVPGDGGVITVSGNLTVTGPIVFNGPGTIINATGCILAPSVEIEVNPTNLPSGPVTLLQQSKSCTNSLSDVGLALKQDETRCNKVVADRDSSNAASTLTVTLSVTGNKCSSGSWRWIVLGTVLGVVAVAAATSIGIWRWRVHSYAASSTRLSK